jgi:hypothetical protein
MFFRKNSPWLLPPMVAVIFFYFTSTGISLQTNYSKDKLNQQHLGFL